MDLLSGLHALLALLCPPRARSFSVGGRALVARALLGEGGYARVYEVADAATGEVFALKELRAPRADAEREVAAHRAVRSADVVELVDAAVAAPPRRRARAARGSDDGGGGGAAAALAGDDDDGGDGGEGGGGGTVVALLLLPLFRAGSLADAVARALAAAPRRAGAPPPAAGAALPERAAAAACAGAARGLAAMHAAGWAHGDVNPRNVLLARGGAGVLADLGSASTPLVLPLPTRRDAARAEEAAAARTSAPFRAPELWAADCGGGAALDGAAADAWALGATFFAALFGLSPFESVAARDGGLALCEASHVRALAPVAWPRAPRVSPAAEQLIAALLARDPRARPTAAAAAAALEALAA